MFALNPEYVKAEYIVIILALQFFLRTITENLQKFIIGIEKIDEEDNPTFKEMMKSKLFKIPTITFVQSISYIVSLTIILIILVSIITSQLELIFYWACVGLIIQIPISAYTTKLFKNNFSSKVNLIEITKYLISAFISSITLILIDKFVVYHTKVFDFLPQILILIFLNGMIYFGITLGIDKKN